MEKVKHGNKIKQLEPIKQVTPVEADVVIPVKKSQNRKRYHKKSNKVVVASVENTPEVQAIKTIPAKKVNWITKQIQKFNAWLNK